MAHLEAFRTNTVDAASAYVAISRARDHAAVYTDNRSRLAHAIGLRDGTQIAALDEDLPQATAMIEMPAVDDPTASLP